jgi:hypothetical protein
MTKEEARKILEIMSTADGGCKYCAGDLLERFLKEFPEHFEVAVEVSDTFETLRKGIEDVKEGRVSKIDISQL